MAGVKIISRHVVKPASETPGGVVALSEFDHVAGNTWVPVLYFYKPSEPHTRTSILAALKESLSRALVHYHPLAGRLHFLKSGRMELHCNSAGVFLDEAEMLDAAQDLPDAQMGELVTDPAKFAHLLPSVDHTKPTEEVPLLHVQITHFGCGGLSFGFIMSHAIADGCSAFYFITDWARISRGGEIEIIPSHDRSILKAGEPSKEEGPTAAIELPTRKADEQPAPPPETDRAILPLTKSQVEKLKKSANAGQVDGSGRPYSRYEVLAAHIWRSTCKARGHANDETRALGIAIDARYRLPSFPKKYFGNSAFVVAAKAGSGDLVSSPLGYTCQRIRQTIERVNEDYIWAEIDFFKKIDDFSVCQEFRALRSTDGPYVNPNPGVISWLSMPLYGLDFGWGKEVHVSSSAHGVDGLAFVYPSRDEGDVVVSLSLQVDCIDQFKKHFYDDIM